MDTLTKKTLKTSRGYNYTYYVSPASQGKPTLLLLHGFPDHAEMWETLATKHLVPSGYGVVIPDCLGYDGTDKPTDPAEYAFSGQTQDMCDILDAEGIDKIITAGHDWGAGFAHRVWIHHPERCNGMATLNVAYSGKPAGPTNIDKIRPIIEKAVGYFPMWYWELFQDPTDGPKILGEHNESMYCAAHGDPDLWLETLCAKDGLKNFLLEDRTCEIQEYAKKPGAKEAFLDRMARDGYTAPLCWYRSSVEGHQYQAEKSLPEERYVVNVPYLFVAGLKDRVCLAKYIEQPKAAGLVPHLTVEEVDTGHWSMLAEPDEVGKHFLNWLGKTYPGGASL